MKNCTYILLILIFSTNLFAYAGNVQIRGRFMQTKMSSVNLLYYDVMKEDFTYISKSSVSSKGTFLFDFNLTKPIYCKFYEDFFFITPGDLIYIEINDDTLSTKGYKLKITGKNASHYTFSAYLKKKSTINIDREVNQYQGKWIEFQKTCFQKYQEDTHLLTTYALQNKASNEFVKYIKEYLYTEYLQFPLIPLHGSDKYDTLLIEQQYRLLNMDSIFSIESHFQHQPFIQFSRDYLKFIDSKNAHPDEGIGENTALYEYINTNYTGHIRELFLVFIFNQAYKRPVPKERELVQVIRNEAESFNDQKIQKYIYAKYQLLSTISNKLPDSITNIQLIRLDGSKTTLKTIIDSLKGKYILIDNWATWCGPCLQEIEKAKTMQNTGVIEKDGIVILYLSEDKIVKNWKLYMQKNSKVLRYSYLNVNTPNAFMQYFNINSIPRYILLGKEGELISADAPRVSEYEQLFKLIKEDYRKKL